MKKIALSILLFTVLLFTSGVNAAGIFKDYKPGVTEKAVSKGETILLDFYAPWCSTCRRQSRVIDELVKENSAYKSIQFIRVDWDTYKNSDLVAKYGVPRRSTLVLLKGGKERGKIIAQTGKSSIKALLDKGL